MIQHTKSLCQQYNIYPNHREGQNFLVDKDVLNQIIEAANLKKDDIVLEIGPGLGVLTQELAKKVKKVIAVEKDKQLVGVLKNILKSYSKVEIIEDDILKIPNFPPVRFAHGRAGKLQISKYKIVANLPYNITSVVLRKFLAEEPRPEEMVLMVQKEVAERVVARSGKMSILSVSVQFYAQPEIVALVSPKSFWPSPKVASAILKIVISRPKILSKNDFSEKDFFRLVKIGFSSRRKQLQNNLSSGLKMSKKEVQDILINLGFNPQLRAQDLSIVDWLKLFEKIKNSN